MNKLKPLPSLPDEQEQVFIEELQRIKEAVALAYGIPRGVTMEPTCCICGNAISECTCDENGKLRRYLEEARRENKMLHEAIEGWRTTCAGKNEVIIAMQDILVSAPVPPPFPLSIRGARALDWFGKYLDWFGRRREALMSKEQA